MIDELPTDPSEVSGWLFVLQEPHVALDILVTTGSINGFAC